MRENRQPDSLRRANQGDTSKDARNTVSKRRQTTAPKTSVRMKGRKGIREKFENKGRQEGSQEPHKGSEVTKKSRRGSGDRADPKRIEEETKEANDQSLANWKVKPSAEPCKRKRDCKVQRNWEQDMRMSNATKGENRRPPRKELSGAEEHARPQEDWQEIGKAPGRAPESSRGRALSSKSKRKDALQGVIPGPARVVEISPMSENEGKAIADKIQLSWSNRVAAIERELIRLKRLKSKFGPEEDSDCLSDDKVSVIKMHAEPSQLWGNATEGERATPGAGPQLIYLFEGNEVLKDFGLTETQNQLLFSDEVAANRKLKIALFKWIMHINKSEVPKLQAKYAQKSRASQIKEIKKTNDMIHAKQRASEKGTTVAFSARKGKTRKSQKVSVPVETPGGAIEVQAVNKPRKKKSSATIHRDQLKSCCEKLARSIFFGLSEDYSILLRLQKEYVRKKQLSLSKTGVYQFCDGRWA